MLARWIAAAATSTMVNSFSSKWTTVFSPVPIPQARSLNTVVVLLVAALTTPRAMARLDFCPLTLPITGLENGGQG